MSLIYERGFKPNSMEIVNTRLHPVFTSAVRDGYIRLNPSDGVMAEIKKSHTWEKPKCHALTERQQELFVDFTVQFHQHKQQLEDGLMKRRRRKNWSPLSNWREKIEIK